MFEYHAVILRVVDGDTVNAHVDLGFDIGINMKLRLLGINAPEMSTAAGKAARLHLISLLQPGAPAEALPLLSLDPVAVRIRTAKDRQEKYGRYLAELWLESTLIKTRYVEATPSLNTQMVEDGFAVRYMP